MKRSFTAWLRLIGLSSVLGSTAYGQVPEGFNLRSEAYNYAPAPEFRTEQLFAPIDISSYGSGPKRNEGWFCTFDYVYYNIPAPDVADIGQRSFLTWGDSGSFDNQSSSFISPQVNTGTMQGEFVGGTRLDLGFIRENRGWMFSGTFLPTYTQSVQYTGQVVVPFTSNFQAFDGGADPDSPQPRLAEPVTFREISVRQETNVGSYELMHTWRFRRPRPPQTWDPLFEVSAGVRYMNINDKFLVDGKHPDPYDPLRPVQPVPDFLPEGHASSTWNTWFDNNLVGPQLALRYQQQLGPYKFDIEAKGCAAINFMDARQQVSVSQVLYDQAYVAGLGYPIDYTNGSPFYGTASSDKFTTTRFTPVAEFRVNGEYLLTRLISVRGGWSCIYIGDGVGRAANSIDYHLPSIDDAQLMGLKRDGNFQDMFMHGVNIGVTINR